MANMLSEKLSNANANENNILYSNLYLVIILHSYWLALEFL